MPGRITFLLALASVALAMALWAIHHFRERDQTARRERDETAVQRDALRRETEDLKSQLSASQAQLSTSQAELSALRAKDERAGTVPQPLLAGVNVDVEARVRIHSAEDAASRRRELCDVVWGAEAPPLDRLPAEVEARSEDDRFADLEGLDYLDRLTVVMECDLRSVVYYFHAVQPNGALALYHQGHEGDFFAGKETIGAFLEKGYDVLAFAMPLLGMNNQPRVFMPVLGPFHLTTHEHLKFFHHPLRFFLEPVAQALNHALKTRPYKHMVMLGLSGGGWTTTFYAAVDTRIWRSYPVAGTTPVFLRSDTPADWGDFEQTVPEALQAANYPERYILGAAGAGRREIQVLNEFDPACFAGRRATVYEGTVREHVKTAGKGYFGVYFDSANRTHSISKESLAMILADIEGPDDAACGGKTPPPESKP